MTSRRSFLTLIPALGAGLLVPSLLSSSASAGSHSPLKGRVPCQADQAFLDRVYRSAFGKLSPRHMFLNPYDYAVLRAFAGGTGNQSLDPCVNCPELMKRGFLGTLWETKVGVGRYISIWADRDLERGSIGCSHTQISFWVEGRPYIAYWIANA